MVRLPMRVSLAVPVPPRAVQFGICFVASLRLLRVATSFCWLDEITPNEYSYVRHATQV